MILRPTPTSSTERVRQFRQRNPGYDRAWKARREAEALARRAAMQAQAVVPAEAVEPVVVKPMLMLPAPVQDPMMAEIEALKAKLAALEAIALPRAA